MQFQAPPFAGVFLGGKSAENHVRPHDDRLGITDIEVIVVVIKLCYHVHDIGKTMGILEGDVASVINRAKARIVEGGKKLGGGICLLAAVPCSAESK